MTLPIPTTYAPMEAQTREALPVDDGWLYEPKWDGFRCLAFRDAEAVDLMSKAGKPLARYFPDVVATMREIGAKRFVLDGEIVVPVGGALSFDDLLMRIHPAASRVKKLAAEIPAVFIAFDLLVDERGTNLAEQPLRKRRPRLEGFTERYFASAGAGIRLSPATADAATARQWLADAQGDLDGVIAKKLDVPYQTGTREGMVKVKRLRTADCVVGGFRWGKDGRNVGSLLLGLYEEGLLHHVGFCSAFSGKLRQQVNERIPPLRGGEGFTGRVPGGPSRWRKEGSGDYEAVRPEVVVEVEYDHFTSGRFRHGTRFLRWRPDKDPATCTMDQVTGHGARLELT